uniref:Putative ovule protein n=1 Tax=Solanum chacoense TaxID=4108 RepID=A0A0V0J0M9_SOLCH
MLIPKNLRRKQQRIHTFPIYFRGTTQRWEQKIIRNCRTNRRLNCSQSVLQYTQITVKKNSEDTDLKPLTPSNLFSSKCNNFTIIKLNLQESPPINVQVKCQYFIITLEPCPNSKYNPMKQGDALMLHTDLKVGKYWGEMGVDYWDAAAWQQQVDDHEVLVMTPAILLAALRHSFLQIDMIKVIIFDECHNARGKHPYASIMVEFYHHQLTHESAQLPRIFGMTASPIKSKGASTAHSYWQKIRDLENLMNSKVYTCSSESVLAEYIPFSNPKLKIYEHVDIPCTLFNTLAQDLERLREKHECSISKSNLSSMSAGSARRRLSKLYLAFLFCLSEMGVWLAFKAAEFLSFEENDFFSWGEFDACAQTIVRDFSLGASKIFLARLPSGPHWSIGGDIQANADAGYLSSKVNCLLESLLEYRDRKDLRCIIFVERIVTAIVLRSLLNELLPERSGWRTEYTAGHISVLQSQSRKIKIKLLKNFARGW